MADAGDTQLPDPGVGLAFERLTSSRSADEVDAVLASDPRLLTPGFEASLYDLETRMRRDGRDVSMVAAWRLVLRSIREGRNLYRSTYELLDSESERAFRDKVLAEPLLLDPVIDTLLLPFIRGARQQGLDNAAAAIEGRRRVLARFRADGPVGGYFDLLVDRLISADPAGQVELRRENADLIEDFQRYAEAQAKLALQLGHHVRMQQLLMAAAVLGASSSHDLSEEDPGTADAVSRLAGLFLFSVGRPAQREALLARPELLAGTTVFLVAGLLTSEMRRAALECDVVDLRKLWMSRTLLSRCQEIGVAGAFAELERGALWPSPSERI